MKNGLPAILDSSTEILIMGSFPGEEALEKGKYYIKHSNDFWKLMSSVIRQDLTAIDYDSRVVRLLGRGIGLWNVYRSVERKGSMDKDIKKIEMNDFSTLPSIAPGLRVICFNGKEAGKHAGLFENMGYMTKVLPSSSGANRTHMDRRLREWTSILYPDLFLHGLLQAYRI